MGVDAKAKLPAVYGLRTGAEQFPLIVEPGGSRARARTRVKGKQTVFVGSDLALLILLGSATVGGVIALLRGHNVALAMLVSAVLAILIFPAVGWVLLLVVPGKRRTQAAKPA